MILIVVLLVFALISEVKKAQRVKILEACRNNLKMVGLAYRTWSLDSRDNIPQEVPIKEGGSKELLTSGQLFSHFQVMSNEIGTPKLLVCPADRERVIAKNFLSGGNSNVSYFASLDAHDTLPSMFLSGDRNFALNGKIVGSGTLQLTTNALMPIS